MNFRLKQLRRAAKLTQAELAQAICVDIKTIGNWERGDTTPDAEQLWNCAQALSCTPNDIVGWYESHPKETVLDDIYEKELVASYRESTVQRQANILQTARDAAGMSKDAAERGVPTPSKREAV